MNNHELIPIEQRVTEKSHILEALDEMKAYRNWATQTYESYKQDINFFEDFMLNIGFEPTLINVKLHLAAKFLNDQEGKFAPGTINRRISALSSVFAFYQALGIISSNPFKALDKPIKESSYRSVLLEIEDLKKIIQLSKQLKHDGVDIELPIRMIIFTGLRKSMLASSKVKDIHFEHELLQVNAGYVNSKHKYQFIPIPPKLINMLKERIESQELSPEDSFLTGINGKPLSGKQINTITDRINKELGWEKDRRITPHGFRSTLATLLSERGVDLNAIKLSIGHSGRGLEYQENVWIYIRKNKRYLNMIRNELTAIEEELESIDNRTFDTKTTNISTISTEVKNPTSSISEQVLVRLLDEAPELALKLIEKQFTVNPSIQK